MGENNHGNMSVNSVSMKKLIIVAITGQHLRALFLAKDIKLKNANSSSHFELRRHNSPWREKGELSKMSGRMKLKVNGECQVL
jgi:hypothetical protein